MKKLNALSALVVVSFITACGAVETPSAPASQTDAAVALKPDAASAATTATAVTTSTATSTVAATGGSVTNVNTDTNVGTGGNTGTGGSVGTGGNAGTVASTATNADAGSTIVADAKPATAPDSVSAGKADGSVVVDDAPLACVPNPSGEICGNGLDDNCNGLIDEGCGPAPECSGTETQDCNQTIGGTVYTGKKQCVNGKFTACLNLVPPAPKPDTTDHNAPTVALPICSLADTTNLPVGIAIPFYVSVSDDTGLNACQFYLNAEGLGGQGVSGTSASLEQDITLAGGTSTIFVICFDTAGNAGQSVTLTVKAVSSDAGVQLNADALPSVDTKPAADTFVASPDAQAPVDTTPAPAADAGTDTLNATDTLVAADTKPLGDAGSAGCFALVNNQYMTIPFGQAIVCAAGSLSGSQTCQTDGTLTACTPTGTAKSNLRAVINCRLDKVVLSGDVMDNLFPSLTDTSPLLQICLVGDGVVDENGNGGMINTFRKFCQSYYPDSSHQYIFNGLTFGAALYRITFYGVTEQTASTGQVRWSNNNPDLGNVGTNGIVAMANDPNNLCSITRQTIGGETAKLVVNGTGTPLTQ
jgi:hypothetical protein